MPRKEITEMRRSKGLCPRCGGPIIDSQFKTCSFCRSAGRAYHERRWSLIRDRTNMVRRQRFLNHPELREIRKYHSKLSQGTASLKIVGVCAMCGERKETVGAHVIPKSVGGKDEPSNLIELCRRCHGSQHLILMVVAVEKLVDFMGYEGAREYLRRRIPMKLITSLQ